MKKTRCRKSRVCVPLMTKFKHKNQVLGTTYNLHSDPFGSGLGSEAIIRIRILSKGSDPFGSGSTRLLVTLIYCIGTERFKTSTGIQYLSTHLMLFAFSINIRQRVQLF